MGFLYLLESIRTPFLDTLMMLLPLGGGDLAFLAVALVFSGASTSGKAIISWGVGLTGTLAAQFLKLTCRVPRALDAGPQFHHCGKGPCGSL